MAPGIRVDAFLLRRHWASWRRRCTHSRARVLERKKGIKQFNTAIISGLGSLIKMSFDRSLILLPLA